MSDSVTPTSSSLGALDAWAQANPWHPRILPFVAYIAAMFVTGLATSASLWAYPAFYTAQCLLAAWLLWRYRKLVPELTLRFHWLAIPTGLAMTVAWVELGGLMVWLAPESFGPKPIPGAGATHEVLEMRAESETLYHLSLGLRLLGMSLVVPVFEELFIRSAMLRGLHRFRPTMLGLTQVLIDMPVIGEWIEDTELGQRAAAAPPQLTRQLTETPVGHLTVFGILASTLVFAISHAPRDWPGCFACGVTWCVLLWWTNRPSLPAEQRLGIGPIAWSHGICNATLWYYCVSSGDWQWL